MDSLETKIILKEFGKRDDINFMNLTMWLINKYVPLIFFVLRNTSSYEIKLKIKHGYDAFWHNSILFKRYKARWNIL